MKTSTTQAVLSVRNLRLALICLALGAGGIRTDGADIFTLDAATRNKLRTSSQGQAMLAAADKLLTVEPVSPDRDYVAKSKTNSLLWPRIVGIPLVAWMEKLGYAYIITGNRKYADKGIALLTATCRNFPVTNKKIQGGMPGARGHITYGLALGYLFFGSLMTSEQRDLIAETGKGYIDDFIRYFGDPKSAVYLAHNHIALNGAPAGILAWCFRHRSEFARRLEKVVFLLEGWINHCFDPQGLYLEGHCYARYGMVPRMMIFAWLLRGSGGKDFFKNPRLKNMPFAFVETLIPGTRLHDTRGDNDYASAGLECLFLAVANQDPVAMWLWEKSQKELKNYFLTQWLLAQGTPKGVVDFAKFPLSAYFPIREYALWRTGWQKNDVLFSIESGPYGRAPNGKGGSHAQSDKGHFCCYGLGEMWAIDSGYANDWFVQDSRSNSFAHNLVLIDGQGQVTRRVDGKMTAYSNSKDFGYSCSDLTSAYNINDSGKTGAGLRRAIRQTLFIRPSNGIPAYAVVLDDMEKDNQRHRYSWLMMVPSDKIIELNKNGAMLKCRPFREYVHTPEGAPNGRVEWKFELAKPQTVSVWVRGMAGAAYPVNSNSFWLKIDNRKPVKLELGHATSCNWYLFAGPAKKKSLVSRRLVPIKFNLGPGAHKLAFTTREKEAGLAEVYLAFDASTPFNPSKNSRKLNLADASISGGMVLNKTGRAASPRCAVYINAASILKLSHDLYFPPNSHYPRIIQRLRADTVARNPYFAALLLPLPEKQKAPKVEFVRRDKILKITLKWENMTDTIKWSTGTDGKTIRPTYTRGENSLSR